MTDYGHDLLFGTFVTPVNGPPHQPVELAQHTERAGLDLVTFQDHPYQSAFHDTWTLLSYVAARTERVTLAPNVANLPLRQPAVLARAAASLDLLSGGRLELGLGAGAFWDAIAAMGGPRLRPGESVAALEEAIGILRGMWDTEDRSVLRVEGDHHRVSGAKRGPAPAHHIGIWLGAYKPRMLRLTGRLADGWLPSQSYLRTGEDLARSNRIIDEAAKQAGRDARAIRRLLNVTGPTEGSGSSWPEQLAELALEHGTSAFILATDDPRTIDVLGQEVAPAVRELVAAERERRSDDAPSSRSGVAPHGGSGAALRAGSGTAPVDVGSPLGTTETEVPPAAGPGGSQWDRLGVRPTQAPGIRHGGALPWDESTRPRRPESGPEVTYTEQGRAMGQHLIDVHDMLRRELDQVRSVIAQVKDLSLDVGSARSALNEMTMRQNDWTLGAYCARYCTTVTTHHSLEDSSVFPHLRARESELAPVLDRLREEHLVIHDVIEQVDRALVRFVSEPGDFGALDEAVDALTDTLLSHLAYEEEQLVEPLARHGYYTGQG
jgi:hemerythrin-like domain-containing protein